MNWKDYFLFILILFLGCSKSQKVKEQYLTSNINFVLSDTICIHIDTTLNYKHRHSNVYDTDTGLIYFAVDRQNNMQIYDLERDSLLHRYTIPQEGPGYVSTYGLYVHNFDSIFGLRDNPVMLYLFDKYGYVKKKWQIPSPIQDVKGFGAMSQYNYEPYYYADRNSISFNGSYGTEMKDIFINPYELNFSLTSLKYIAKFGQIPDIFQGNLNLFPWKEVPTRAVNDTLTLLSFEMLDYIEIYNNLSGTLLKRIQAKSNFIKRVNPCKNCDSKQKKSNYSHTEATYFNIIYDKYNDLYYRLAKHKQALRNSNGLLNQVYNAKWSILIFDNKFDFRGEHVFEPNKYNMFHVHPIKGGLLIGTNNEFNPEYSDENIIKFHKFNLNYDE